MTCRVAPDGFTVDQWETFNRDGIIFIENALINQEIDDYLSAINDLTDQSGRYKEGNFLGHDNIVEKSPLFANLIDPPRHIGYAYDLFGELLKLHQSQVFIRPPGGSNYNISGIQTGPEPCWTAYFRLNCLCTLKSVIG